MQTRNRRRYIIATISWLSASALVLTLLQSLTLELFFVIALIGILIVTELSAPINLTPRWRRRIKWILIPLLLVFGYIVVRRILEILPEGVV